MNVLDLFMFLDDNTYQRGSLLHIQESFLCEVFEMVFDLRNTAAVVKVVDCYIGRHSLYHT